MIRLAKNNDINFIYNLGELVNKDFKKLFNVKDILQENFSKIYVYEKDKTVVGFLHITELYEIVDIINIVVAEEYRHQKIATNLIDYMFSDVTNKVKTITLEVNENNISAINLYKKMGFEIINIRYKYYGKDNAYLMAKGKL